MKGPQVSLSIIAIAVLLLGSGSAVAHHYPPVDHLANWTIYEGADGYMQVSEDDTKETEYENYRTFYASVFIELPEGMTATEYCGMPFFSQPTLYDSDGFNGENSPGQGDGYYVSYDDCSWSDSKLPLYKDPNTGLLDASSRCFVNIGFVNLRGSSDDILGTYEWDSSHTLFVEHVHHHYVSVSNNGCEEKGEFPMALVLGGAVTVIAILGGIFYWRKDEGTEEESEEESEIPVQQPESSEPAVVNDQDGGLLEEKESNQEKNEGGRNSKFCPSCGLTNDSNGKFCKDCGTDLSV